MAELLLPGNFHFPRPDGARRNARRGADACGSVPNHSQGDDVEQRRIGTRVGGRGCGDCDAATGVLLGGAGSDPFVSESGTRLSRSNRSAAGPRNRASDDAAALLLDPLGRVRSCTSAAALLLGEPPERLLRQEISALIPSVPIREGTPGYNSAFVAFWFGQGQWWTREFVGTDGSRIVIALTVEPIAGDEGSGYRVTLRSPPGGAWSRSPDIRS